jgi:hypothetical protein
MKHKPIHSMNPSYGREKNFQIKSVLQCKCNAQFPFRYQYKQSFSNEQCLYVFFNTSINTKSLFSNVFEKTKKKLERKLVVHFPRRTLINEKRKSNHKDSNKNNPTKTFNESKNQKQTNEFLNANEKCSFEPPSK